MPGPDDPTRAEFAALAARALSAGLFGMSDASPREFIEHIGAARIHPDAIVMHRNDGVAVGAGYLFRARSEAPWELRVSLEPAIKDDAERARVRCAVLLGLTRRCRELGVSMRHVRLARSTPTAAELTDAGFREVDLEPEAHERARRAGTEVALYVFP
jgi:N-acyl-D-aspartate/D-glutamate deacylase